MMIRTSLGTEIVDHGASEAKEDGQDKLGCKRLQAEAGPQRPRFEPVQQFGDRCGDRALIRDRSGRSRGSHQRRRR